MVAGSIYFNGCFASAFAPDSTVKPSNPLSSHFGFLPVSHDQESWPELDGKPLVFVCQLNLSAAPEVISTLQHVKLITFFITPDHSKVGPANGQGWCLRTYDTFEGLSLLSVPESLGELQGISGGWIQDADFPWHNDPDIIGTSDAETVEFPQHCFCTKIWGWPTGLKDVVWWQKEDVEDPQRKQIIELAKPSFDMQIVVQGIRGVHLGHYCDVLLLARGTTEGYKDKWYLDWQYHSDEDLQGDYASLLSKSMPGPCFPTQ